MIFMNSWTDEETGASKVLIRHRKHIYPGYAICHPDDEYSKYTGCRYAEMRAKIAALKAEHKQKKAACEECGKFVKAVSQYKKFNKEDPTAKAMYRQLNRRIKEVNKLVDKINQLEFDLKLAINQQVRIKKRIKVNNH